MVLAHLIQKPTLMQGVQQPKTHAFVESGARHNIAQPSKAPAGWKLSSTREACASDVTM